MNKAIDVLWVTLIEAAAFIGGVGIWFAFHDAGSPVVGALAGTAFWSAVTYAEHFVALVQNVS